MSGQSAVVISFVIYLAFFAWLGWRRGSRREFTAFSVALVSWILLRSRGDIVVTLTNLAGAALTFARSGGFNESSEDAFAALANAPDLVASEAQDAFLFIVWVAIFVATYALTNVIIKDKQSERNGWSVLLGIFNGLFFAVAFVPSIVALFGGASGIATDGTDGAAVTDFDLTLPNTGADLNLFSLVGTGLGLIWDGISSLWTFVDSIGSLGLLVLLTAFLVMAALSIRQTAARAKS